MKKMIILAVLFSVSSSFAEVKDKKTPEQKKLEKECHDDLKAIGCVRKDGTVERACDRLIELSPECRESLSL